MIWFTSDTHYFHARNNRHSKPPFRAVEEMNAELARRWNAVVGTDDEVFHLGDVGFGNRHRIDDVLGKLKGKKHLCPGNHDYRNDLLRLRAWHSVEPYREIVVDGRFVVLLHYGMRVWNRSHHGSIQLYGHSHGNLPGNSQSLDVGVDCWDYAPVSLPEIVARLATLPPYRSKDHQPSEEVPS